MAIVGLLATVYAIKQLSVQAAPLIPIMFGVGGLALLIGFVRRQARVSDPIVDLALFTNRSFTVPLVGNALAFAVLYGTQLLIGQYLQAVLGMTPLQAGHLDHPQRRGVRARWAAGPPPRHPVGQPAGDHRRSCRLGCGLRHRRSGGHRQRTACVHRGQHCVLDRLGAGLPGDTQSTVAAVPSERAGVAGATLETITNLGGALGIALFGSMAGAAYRLGTADTGIQTQTIGDVIAQAARLPEQQAAELIRTTQTAFVNGFRLIEIVGAVLLLIAASSPGVFFADRGTMSMPATPNRQNPGPHDMMRILSGSQARVRNVLRQYVAITMSAGRAA